MKWAMGDCCYRPGEAIDTGGEVVGWSTGLPPCSVEPFLSENHAHPPRLITHTASGMQ